MRLIQKKRLVSFIFFILKEHQLYSVAMVLYCFECDIYLKSASLLLQGTNNEAEQSDP